jgi:hypothetical protein
VIGPVTPTIVNGCAANNEKTTAAKTEERRTSFTPKLDLVLANISNENARAGRILYMVSEYFEHVIL